jgi:DNA polymerase III subunit alpha
VRNVGEGLVGHIVAEREASGPYVDFYDFCERVDLTVLNKRTIESLIKAGAFDSLDHPRQGLLTVFEQIVDSTVARRRERDMGVMTLFGEADDGPVFDERARVPDLEFDKMTRLAFEKEMLGLYVSDHPLMGAESALRRRTDCGIAELAEVDEGAQRTVGGVVTGLQRKWTRKGDLMAVFILEDLQGSTEVMVFPKTMQTFGHMLEDDRIVCVKGRVDKRDDLPKLMATDISLFDGVTTGSAPPLRIRLSPATMSDDVSARLKALLADHPGDSEVFLHIGETTVVKLPDAFSVDVERGVVGELRVLLGPDAIVL